MALCIAFLIGGVTAAEQKYPGVPPVVKIKDDALPAAELSATTGSNVVVSTPYYVRYYGHGAAAHLQTPSAASYSDYYGWGLDFIMKPGQSTWFHIPTTSPSNAGSTIKARYVVVQWFQGGDTSVGTIDVRNGADLIAHKTYTWGYWGSPGYKTATIDLGNYYEFNRGLDISCQVAGGVEQSGSWLHRVIAVSAGGHFKFE